MKTYAIILASGVGSRTKLKIPKQFFNIAGKTILEHSVDIFIKSSVIDHIIIVVHPNFLDQIQLLYRSTHISKPIDIIAGGSTRQESSYKALSCIKEDHAYVLIHDSVRPFLPSYIIENMVEQLGYYSAVNTVIPSSDTLITIDEKQIITDVPPRSYFRRGQTPQAFHKQMILKAHQKAIKNNDNNNTDDCSLVIKYSKDTDIKTVEGDEFNIKITSPLDIIMADKLFQLKTIKGIKLSQALLENQVIVIFGASSGIGKAIYNIASEANAKIYGFSRSEGVDITKPEDIKKALNTIYQTEGKINSIIVTAGKLHIGKIIERSFEDISKEIALNYLGCVSVAQLSYSYLKETLGHLIFFASSSYTKGRANYSTYSSMKAALVNFTQALAEEWYEDNIKVNIINPEKTNTPMRTQAFGKEPENTLLTAEEVAIQTLATITHNITGQVIDIKK